MWCTYYFHFVALLSVTMVFVKKKIYLYISFDGYSVNLKLLSITCINYCFSVCYLDYRLGLSRAMLLYVYLIRACPLLIIRACPLLNTLYMWTCVKGRKRTKPLLPECALLYFAMYMVWSLTKNLNTCLILSCEWPSKSKACAYMSCQTAALLIILLFELEQCTWLKTVHTRSAFYFKAREYELWQM